MRVIVVDDFGSMRKIVRAAMANLGFSDIIEAVHGKEAWDLIIESCKDAGNKIELGIVDLNMPVMSGLTLLKKIRGDKRLGGFVFVMLTSEQLLENIVSAKQAGVDEYMIKPFSQGMLQGRLLNIAEKKLGEIEEEFVEYLPSIADKVKRDELDNNDRDKIVGFIKRNVKAGEIAPWSHLGPLALGKLFIKVEDYEQAEIQLRKAISNDFGVTEIHDLMFQVLRALGKTSESTEKLKMAVQDNPESGELRLKLADAYLRLELYDMAIEEFKESLKLLDQSDAPLIARCKDGLGKAIIGKEEAAGGKEITKEAVELLESAVQLNPDFIPAHYNLMSAYKKLGRGEEALKIYQFLQSQEPKDADGWVAIGKAHMDYSEPSKATVAFKKAEDLASGMFNTYADISTSLYRHNALDEALHYLSKTEEINPSDIFSYNLKGIIYRRKKQYAKAVKEYLFASQLDRNDASIFFNLAVAYFKSGQKGRSLTPFMKAKELNPNLTEVDDYLKQLGPASKAKSGVV